MGCDIKNVKISINLFYIKKISRYLQYILLFMYRVFFYVGTIYIVLQRLTWFVSRVLSPPLPSDFYEDRPFLLLNENFN